MLAFLTALAGIANTACTPVPGADRLWQPTTRWVIVGEMHGTNETPDAFANLACLAAQTGRPVTVAVEYAADWQPVIDTYLASDGGRRARAALLALPIWHDDMQTGRSSRAFLRLWDRLRRMKQAGTVDAVVATDQGRAAPADETRDAAMAKAWTALAVPENGLVLALVGNFHAIRKPVALGEETVVTAGSLMPAARTMTVNVVASGGTAWNCQEDGCKAHDNGLPRHVATGVVYVPDADRRWDALYELGVPTTASAPAVPPKNATPRRGRRART